uniref:Uncharacterized protein n=1 Tax=Daucus carota subsp. sativus TaxID=79200 RepID=A0A164Y7T4_DAUCS
MHNIKAILNTLLGSHRNKLLFIWDHDDCTNIGLKCLRNKRMPVFLKELNEV